MLGLTDLDYDLDRYREEDMDSRRLRYRPVSPAIKAMAERMRQEPNIVRTPRLNGMDEAVLQDEGAK